MQQVTATVGRVYDEFCSIIEKDNRMTEFGLYGLASGALLYAYARKRPISKFTKASDIPNHFLKEKVLQAGVVRKIEPTGMGPVLLVNHKPPVDISITNRALPIKVAGVHIDGNGFSWLQILATNEKVKFLPCNNTGNECEAIVFLEQKNKQDLDIGRALVGLGFAKAAPLSTEIYSQTQKGFVNYHKQLKSSEAKARRWRKGQWSTLPEPWLRWYLRTEWEKFVFNVKKGDRKLPALVR